MFSFNILTKLSLSSPLRLKIYRLTNFRAKIKIEPALAGGFEFRAKISEPVNHESQRAELWYSFIKHI